MNSQSSDPILTPLCQNDVVYTADLLCSSVNKKISTAELEEFQTRVKALEQNVKFNESIEVFSEKNLLEKDIEKIYLPEEDHVPAMFLIIKKIIPHTEIPISLQFKDVVKTFDSIVDAIGILYDFFSERKNTRLKKTTDLKEENEKLKNRIEELTHE